MTERQPRPGLLRIVTLGLFSLVFPPKPELVVTYKRQRQAGSHSDPLPSNYAPEVSSGVLRKLTMVSIMFALLVALLVITG
jgi:hypothetical protein